jgi:YegS/Rv2252/BmrU family lipid kinase
MRIKAIINPLAGRGIPDNVDEQIRRHFPDYSVDIEKTEYCGHAVYIAEQAGREKYDIIIACGGDGTINEIINGMNGAGAALGIIPTGTANDLALYFGIPRDIDRACRVIRSRFYRPVDAIDVNGWLYLTCGGFGLPCQILSLIQNHRWFHKRRLLFKRVGAALYIAALIYFLVTEKPDEYKMYIRAGQTFRNCTISSLIIGNLPVLGRNFKALPGAAIDDGLIDACLIRGGTGLIHLITILFRSLNGRHLDSDIVETFRVGRMTIISDRPVAFFGDGEIKPDRRRFDIEILPKAVNLITPERGGNQWN